MGQFTIVLVWMATSGSLLVCQCDAFLLTSANALLSKFIKVPAAAEQSPLPSGSRPDAKVLDSSPSVANGYRIEIPVYESMPAPEPSWDGGGSSRSSKSTTSTTAPISSLQYWTYSKLPQHYEVPVLDYLHQSLSWPSTLLESYIAEQGAIDEPASWRTSASTSPATTATSSSGSASSPVAAASYQYPIYLPSTATPSASAKSPTTTSGVYLVGKNNKNFLIPPANSKTKSGHLPLSLIALNSAPQDMLGMFDEKHFEIKPSQSKFSKHYYDDQKTFYHHQTDHVDSSRDPYAETHVFERFRQEQNPNPNQNLYYQRHNQHHMPASIFDQYPYYLEDSFNNFASLLDYGEPEKSQNKYPQKQQQQQSNNNWPHQSKYEPINHASMRKSKRILPNQESEKKDNCTKNAPPSPYKLVQHDESTGFKPMVPVDKPASGQSDYFESLRKRSGFVEKTTKQSGGPLPPSALPQQLVDNLVASNSVKNQMKVKMNEIDDKEGHEDNADTDESMSEKDRQKAGVEDSHRSEDGETASKEEMSDDGNGENGPNYDRERTKWLKDKGYAKHGWKNVYHKEEWGEAKKYHDVWRFKDWKDRYNEKVPSASNVIEALSPVPTTQLSPPDPLNNTSSNEIAQSNLTDSKFPKFSLDSSHNKWIPIKRV